MLVGHVRSLRRGGRSRLLGLAPDEPGHVSDSRPPALDPQSTRPALQVELASNEVGQWSVFLPGSRQLLTESWFLERVIAVIRAPERAFSSLGWFAAHDATAE